MALTQYLRDVGAFGGREGIFEIMDAGGEELAIATYVSKLLRPPPGARGFFLEGFGNSGAGTGELHIQAYSTGSWWDYAVAGDTFTASGSRDLTLYPFPPVWNDTGAALVEGIPPVFAVLMAEVLALPLPAEFRVALVVASDVLNFQVSGLWLQ